MKIAVLIGGIGYDSQKRIINGILDNALSNRAYVYIFTCAGWRYESPSRYEKGEYNVYTLPDFTQYDGVILNGNSIHDASVVRELEERIKEAGVPCVSLNTCNSQFMQVEMDRQGIGEIIRHLTACHNARKIYFISGPIGNYEADERLRIYEDVMAAGNTEWNKGHIFYGDYSYESGRNAVKKFMGEPGGMPDAIVAANDEMALGAVLALEEAGYRVPEDVIVTGYDDSVIARYNYPRITTVRRGEYEAGRIAYEKIAAVLRGEKAEQRTVIHGCPVFAGSCGCGGSEEFDAVQIRRKYIENHVKIGWDMEIIKNSSAEFTGLTDIYEVLKSVGQYVSDMGMEYFYLCMCGSIDNYYEEFERIAASGEPGRDTTVYSDEIWVPFAYEKGKINRYDKFPKSRLLPEECEMEQSGGYYIVMPLHFQDYCYGYCVAGNYQPAFEGNFYQNFILNLDNALETVRKQDLMKAMLQRLNRMWERDELTGVHNRAGFCKHAAQMLEEARKEEKPVGIIFADADGLKKINDTYGHEQGDALIKAMAAIMEQALHPGELLGRFGGDEFVIFMAGYEESDLQNEIMRIQKAFDSYNMLHALPYELSASLGYCVERNAKNADLDRIIKQADEEMYRIKRAKKQAKEPVVS